jgi:hypothetical protein
MKQAMSGTWRCQEVQGPTDCSKREVLLLMLRISCLSEKHIHSTLIHRKFQRLRLRKNWMKLGKKNTCINLFYLFTPINSDTIND